MKDWQVIFLASAIYSVGGNQIVTLILGVIAFIGIVLDILEKGNHAE